MSINKPRHGPVRIYLLLVIYIGLKSIGTRSPSPPPSHTFVRQTMTETKIIYYAWDKDKKKEEEIITILQSFVMTKEHVKNSRYFHWIIVRVYICFRFVFQNYVKYAPEDSLSLLRNKNRDRNRDRKLIKRLVLINVYRNSFKWTHALIYAIKILYFITETQSIKWSNQMTRLLFILYQFCDVTYGIIAYLRWVHIMMMTLFQHREPSRVLFAPLKSNDAVT